VAVEPHSEVESFHPMMGWVPMDFYYTETEHSMLVLMLWALMCESVLELCVTRACRLVLRYGLMLRVLRCSCHWQHNDNEGHRCGIRVSSGFLQFGLHCQC